MNRMITEWTDVFEPITDWIHQYDQHAEHHLSLLEAAEAVLVSGLAGHSEGRELAGRIERWRYRHLQDEGDQRSWQTETLVNQLDQLANRLAGRPDRLPRCTGQAIQDSRFDTDTIREALELVDPRVPLSELTDRASELTRLHFGCSTDDRSAAPARWRMIVYAPLYVSNQCINYCTYCGFRYPLEIARRHLSCDQALDQARWLHDRGFRHLLVVGGDFPSLTTTDYYAEILRAMVANGIVPAVEIAPQSTESYAELVQAGACGVTLYQETYDPVRYREYHLRGPKASYPWRLEALDRAAEAGMARLGLGVLIGLADPYHDIPIMMRHAAYLIDRFPDRTFAFSLPRIHAAPDGFQVPFPIDDQQLIRWYCALRIAFPRAPLVLSTREAAELRNRLAHLCITQMSAGSSTAPGGYRDDVSDGGEQFPVTDQRSGAEVARWLEQSGFQVRWSLDENGS